MSPRSPRCCLFIGIRVRYLVVSPEARICFGRKKLKAFAMNRPGMFLLATAISCVSTLAADALQPGLVGKYYQWPDSLSDFPRIPAGAKPALERIDAQINFPRTPGEFAGTRLTDNFESDDGSRLFIDGKQVVDNGGVHAMEESSGTVQLTAGDHALKVEFFEKDLDAGCKFSWKSDRIEKQIVPAGVLLH